MAKEFTLKGVIKFIDQGASATIKKVDENVVKMGKNTKKIGQGMRQVNQGMLVMGGAGLVVGAGFTKAIKTSAVFEQQMARVGALSRATEEEMSLLTNTAKKLGSTTEFTATQAGQGLEFLSLAGFKASESVSVLPVILDTAAAGALDLGRASDIVTDSMSALGTAFKTKFNTPVQKATRLADIMAVTQSKSNTNIEQLGEAIKFGGGALAGFGVPLTQIIASMGKLADAGLKGSLGGTALTNMMNKLVKPSGKVKGIMSALGVNMEKLPLQDMPKLVNVLSGALGKLKDPNQAAMVATELFGARGIRAYNALKNAGGKALQELTNELDKSQGQAKIIADRQRNTFMGQVKSFQSAVEGIMIEVGNFFTQSEDTVLPAFRNVVKFLQKLGAAFQFVNMSAKDQKKAMKSMAPEMMGMIEFATGFKEGIEEAFKVAGEVFTGIKAFLKDILPAGEDSNKMIGRMIGKFALLLAALAPVLIGFVALSFGVSTVMTTFMGFFNILSGGFGLMKNIVQLIWSFVPSLSTLGKMLGWAKTIFFSLGNVLKFFGGILKTVVVGALGLVKTAVLALGKALLGLAANPVGAVIMAVVALVAIGWLLWKNWDTVTAFMSSAWDGVVASFQFFVGWIKQASIGELILKTILAPLRLALTPIMELINWIANSALAKKFISDENLKSIKQMANAVSLIPTEQELSLNKTETGSISTGKLSEAKLENTRLSQPKSADTPVMMQQPQAQDQSITIENIMMLDGEVVAKSTEKQKIKNSERAGMNATNPKNRSLSKEGGFAPGFSR